MIIWQAIYAIVAVIIIIVHALPSFSMCIFFAHFYSNISPTTNQLNGYARKHRESNLTRLDDNKIMSRCDDIILIFYHNEHELSMGGERKEKRNKTVPKEHTENSFGLRRPQIRLNAKEKEYIFWSTRRYTV